MADRTRATGATESPRASPSGAPPARFRVALASGRVVALPLHTDGPTVFGRAPDCDRRIRSLYFSRHHFMTLPVPDGYLLLDLRGRGGTLLDGRRIRIARLRHGDTVRAGPHLLVFSSGDRSGARCPGCGRRLPAPEPGSTPGACLVCRHRYPLVGTTVLGASVDAPLAARSGLADYFGRLPGRKGAVRIRILEGGASRRVLERIRRFAHPRIVRTRAVGAHEGSAVLLTDLAPPVTLSSLVQTHVPPRSDLVAAVMLGTAQALDLAHRVGLVHGGLRPSCVGIDETGKARLDDLGLGALLTVDEPTETDWFLPPEHRGAPRRTDLVADVYAFGATFYEALTRRVPMPDLTHGSDVSARPVADVRTDLPAPVSRVVDRALARDPRERYRRFAEIVADLGCRGAAERPR